MYLILTCKNAGCVEWIPLVNPGVFYFSGRRPALRPGRLQVCKNVGGASTRR